MGTRSDWREIVVSTPVETVDVRAVNKKENRSLYKKREKIQPKKATGTFRRLKWIIMGITLAIYYVTPWIRWDRGVGAPDQAVLVDLDHGRFYFFFIEIWPQEVYYITGILILAALALFMVTSLFGRAWCGYSCPQTVWTDLFIFVERMVEGDRNARLKLDKAAMSFSKFYKRFIKHSIWLIIGLLTGGAWVFYFADAPSLLTDLVTGEAKTIAIHFFENKAAIVVPELSQVFTQEMRDKFRNESRLVVTNDKGDWDLSGYISQYQTTFLAVQNDQPAKTRLSLSVQVTFINSEDEKKSFDKTYTQYEDFDSDEELSNIELELIEELSERIVIDVFNDTVNNW